MQEKEKQVSVEKIFMKNLESIMKGMGCIEASTSDKLSELSNTLFVRSKTQKEEIPNLDVYLEDVFNYAAEHMPKSAEVMFYKGVFNLRMAEKNFRNKDLKKAKPYFDQGIKDLIDCAVNTTEYVKGGSLWSLPDLMYFTLDQMSSRKEYGDFDNWCEQFGVNFVSGPFNWDPTGSKKEQEIAKGDYAEGLLHLASGVMDISEDYLKNFLKWKYLSIRNLYDKAKVHKQGRSKSTLLPHELLGRQIRENVCRLYRGMDKNTVYHIDNHNDEAYAELTYKKEPCVSCAHHTCFNDTYGEKKQQ